MAATTKTFAFASNTEGWARTGSGTGGHSSADGNPAGSLFHAASGRNTTAAGVWEWTGTFEDLGVPPGDTVTGYQAAAFDHRAAVWDVVGYANIGPFTVNDGANRSLVAQVAYSSQTSWATASSAGQITGLNLPSTTTITLTVEYDQRTGNNNAAAVEVRLDNIALTVSHDAAPTGVTGSLAAAETGSDQAAGAGSVLVSGSLSAAEAGADSASIVGSVTIAGSLVAQEHGSDTLAATGGLISPVTGSLSASEHGQDSASALGAVAITGALAALEAGGDKAAFDAREPYIPWDGFLNGAPINTHDIAGSPEERVFISESIAAIRLAVGGDAAVAAAVFGDSSIAFRVQSSGSITVSAGSDGTADIHSRLQGRLALSLGSGGLSFIRTAAFGGIELSDSSEGCSSLSVSLAGSLALSDSGQGVSAIGLLGFGDFEARDAVVFFDGVSAFRFDLAGELVSSDGSAGVSVIRLPAAIMIETSSSGEGTASVSLKPVFDPAVWTYLWNEGSAIIKAGGYVSPLAIPRLPRAFYEVPRERNMAIQKSDSLAARNDRVELRANHETRKLRVQRERRKT
jgi:hypothetical protein